MSLSEQPFGASPQAGPFGFDYASSSHAVLFYLEENFLLNLLCDFIAGSLRAGNGVVIIVTTSHQQALIERLSQSGIDVGALMSKGSYVAIDANEIFGKYLVDGNSDLLPLGLLLCNAIEGVCKAVQLTGARAMVFGELVTLLWQRRQLETVLALEGFWEQVSGRLPFALLCVYPITEFVEPGTEEAFVRICATDSILIPPDSYSTPMAERRLLEAMARSYSDSNPSS